MTETRKLLSLFTGITFVAFLAFQSVSMTNVSATYGGGDNCNDVFTYEKSSDYSDSRVNINFESGDEQIDVTGVGSYQVIEVALDVESDGHSGYHVYATGPVSNFNPNPGNDIDEARVKVKKVCASPTPSTAPTAIPTAVPTSVPTAIPTIVPTSAPTVIPTSVPSVTPMVTISTDQNETPSVTPEPTVTSTPTVTPTDTPSSSTNNNNNSSSNNSSSNNEVKVAGISALASTGGIIDSLMNSVFVSGLLTFAFGLKRHGKKS